MIEDKDYLEFKDKYDEMVNIFNIASIIEVACVARESIDSIESCTKAILDKGALLSKNYGRKAEEYADTLDADSFELHAYNDAMETIDEMFEDKVSLIIAEEKRAESLYEEAIITKARLEHQRTAAMNEPEYEVYKVTLDKLNSKIKTAKKLKNEVEKTKKLVEILEEKENLTDRTPLISYNQQIDEANRQMETAILEMQACEETLANLNKDYQFALDKNISKASSQTALVEQKEEGSIIQFFKQLFSFLKGGNIKRFQDSFDAWISGQVVELYRELESKVGEDDKKFEDLEQRIDSMEQGNLGRLIGTGRNLVENVKTNLNKENRAGKGIKTGVVVIIKAQETIGKTNGDKMFDGLEAIIYKEEKVSAKKASPKVTKKSSSTK